MILLPFSDVFTDHKLTIQRLRCGSCGYDMPATVRTLINTTQSGDLQRIQATLGATHTYREGEKIFELFSMKSRRINNHDRIIFALSPKSCEKIGFIETIYSNP